MVHIVAGSQNPPPKKQQPRRSGHAFGVPELDGAEVYVYSLDYPIEQPKEIADIEKKVATSRNAEEKKKVEAYHTSGIAIVAKMQGQAGAVFAVAYRPDGQAVASAGHDGMVRLNNPETGKLIHEFAPAPVSRKDTVAAAN